MVTVWRRQTPKTSPQPSALFPQHPSIALQIDIQKNLSSLRGARANKALPVHIPAQAFQATPFLRVDELLGLTVQGEHVDCCPTDREKCNTSAVGRQCPVVPDLNSAILVSG